MSLLSCWKAGSKLLRINFKSTGQYFRFCSTAHRRSSPSLKVNPQELIEEKCDAFYVVRKGNHVGLYRSLSDCQSQVSSSICDHPVSVYKGYLLKKEAEKYLASRGLKNAVYSLNAKDLKEDLFGILVPCPFQEPTVASPVVDLPEKISVITDEPVKEHLKLKYSSEQKQLKKHLKLKHSSKQKQLSDNSEPTVASPVADLPEKISVITDEPVKEHLKLKHSSEQKQLSDNFMSCTLEFYGASAVEAGKGGAGVILRTEDGSVISRLSEGLGAVTTEAAHYKALILGLKQAHKKGFKQIHVQSDSQLVCMQMQGLRKAEKLAELCDEAKAHKEMFVSFSISPVKKSKNSDARAQAAIAIDLPVGEVHEESGETW